MRIVRVFGDVACVVVLSDTDMSILADGVSQFSEESWANLVVSPGVGDQFNSIEKAYLASIGVSTDAV